MIRSLIMCRVLLHLTLTVTMLVSGIGAASARGASPAVDQMVICSGNGMYVVYLDADGEPTLGPHLSLIHI